MRMWNSSHLAVAGAQNALPDAPPPGVTGLASLSITGAVVRPALMKPLTTQHCPRRRKSPHHLLCVGYTALWVLFSKVPVRVAVPNLMAYLFN